MRQQQHYKIVFVEASWTICSVYDLINIINKIGNFSKDFLKLDPPVQYVAVSYEQPPINTGRKLVSRFM